MKVRYFFLCVVLFVCGVVSLSCCSSSQEGFIEIERDPIEDFSGEKFYFVGSFFPSDAKDGVSANRLDSDISLIETEVLLEHCQMTEQRYHCEIVCQSELPGQTPAAFASAYASGSVCADFLCADFNVLSDLYDADLLVDLSTIEAIDLSDEEKWGTESQRVGTSRDGVLYAFPQKGSRYMPVMQTYSGVLVCNREVYDRFSVDTTPRQLIEQGKWTFDQFLDLLKSVYDPSEVDPVSGIVSHDGIASAAVCANGGNVIMKVKGQYVFGYTQERSLHALEWAKRLSRIYGLVGKYEEFEKGTATFCLTRPELIIRSSLENLEWLPFPYGPDVEYGDACSATFGFEEQGTAILKQVDPTRQQQVGIVVNALFEPTSVWGKNGYAEYLKRNYFRSELDYEVYRQQCEQMCYDWSNELAACGVQTRLQQACTVALHASGSVYSYMSVFENEVNMWADEQLN